ncbi:sugar-phosphatase [uncultured Clostridium sp.]|uniref:sugar-phosphatase n=1 Tax=uncultured Clostridium sp. TaxID=59620 RepID=UPI0026285710|nr:sugar-phosphatase [uncultured Clostridium sp.]
MYKLIALDMDGTLLNSEKKISERTKEAIKKAREKGVYVVLASGRPIDGLLKYLTELDLISDDDYVLSYNGCLVQKSKSRDVICDVTIKGEDLNYLYNLSREVGVNIHAFSKTRGLITPKNSKYTQYEADQNFIGLTEVSHENLDLEEEIIKIMMIDEPEILEEGIEKLPEELKEKYSIARSAPFFLEFFNKEANKGLGVKLLAEHLGIKKDEIITMGDAMNDYPMIEYAGLGIVMDNGSDELKEIADYITDSNDNDGVAKAIEKFVL